ncbi:MAG: HAMP domain-containing histidine kinase [Lachnospiraceae bacterium]|nr:HAMP domain-containing histidine kinase [Lachnospiraceae bacterium]
MKKSKKIRAFIYRIITVASCFTMLATACLGKEALINLQREGIGTFSGSIYYLTEFREYISEIYTYAMLGYAGVGDEQGNPLENAGVNTLKNDYISKLNYILKHDSKDLVYFIKVGNHVKVHNTTNTLLYSATQSLLLPEQITLCCHWNGPLETLQFFPSEDSSIAGAPKDYFSQQYRPSNKNAGQIQLVLGFADEDNFQSSAFRDYKVKARFYQRILWALLISTGSTLLFSLLSILTRKAGKTATAEYAKQVVKIYPELKLLLLLILWRLCYDLNLWYFAGDWQFRIIASFFPGMYALFGAFLYLLYRDLLGNGAAFFRHSLLVSIGKYIRNYQGCMRWYRKLSNIYICSILITCLLFGVALTHFLSFTTNLEQINITNILLFIGGVVFLLYSIRLGAFIKDVKTTAEKITSLRQGQDNKPLTLPSGSLLEDTARDLNALEQGMEAAVEENNRSNRMRVELITNVSHDLKTPLTSIINYAELLCEEELSAPSSDYAQALRSKAYRLKSMVQDVFELSKATSGNLPVENVRLDLAKLIRQTLADMDERIQDSPLTFKLNIISEPLMIEADGERLYRVFQNLIVNALQYSLDHSRVYVLLDQEDGYAYAKIKNTSREELNFKPEDIVERFVRSDKSRTTEGSGLGLSIAQGFTEACGGTFSLELDADLFTVTLRFPLAAPDPQGETNHEDIEAASVADK